MRLLVGSCAAEHCKPRQGREEATVSRPFWVPQGRLISSLMHMAGGMAPMADRPYQPFVFYRIAQRDARQGARPLP